MEIKWKHIEEGNGKKNCYLYSVFGSSQRMKLNGNHYHQLMKFLANWENSLLSSNANSLMRD